MLRTVCVRNVVRVERSIFNGKICAERSPANLTLFWSPLKSDQPKSFILYSTTIEDSIIMHVRTNGWSDGNDGREEEQAT